MDRVFVTGATGFVGAALVRELLARSVKVGALIRESADRSRLGADVEHIEIVQGSMDDVSAFSDRLCRFAPDTVMHLAWSGVARAQRDNPADCQTNLAGSMALFTSAVAAGCRTFVGAGSRAEYGPRDAQVTENDPTAPVSPYGAAKLATFRALSALADRHEIRFAWLRLFSVYGPMDRPGTLIGTLIPALLRGERPALTAAEQHWDFLCVDDAARAFVAVGETHDAEGAFNVSSGHARPLREAIEMVRDVIDPNLPLGFGDIPYPAHQPTRVHGNITRLCTATGWHPLVPLEAGLASTVQWHMRQMHPSRTI